LVFTLLAIAIAAAACVKQPSAQSCPTGIYCPAGMGCAANQAVCIVDLCGNGVLDPGEACDDGNIIDGDGCSADCKSNETCGNGIVDKSVGEQCDLGPGKNVPGSGCTPSCKSEVCGNGTKDPGEECDGGGETSYCNSDCTLSRCGDGKLNVTAGEQCDDGNTSDGDDCTSKCLWAICGDGFVDHVVTSSRYEECDLGAGNNIDDPTCLYGQTSCVRCSSTCRNLTPVVSYCGNGVIDTTPNGPEPCDSPLSVACGTCAVVNSSTCKLVPRANATGSITVVSHDKIADGDAITIDDGNNPAVMFHLEVGSCPTTAPNTQTLRCVLVQNNDNNRDIACSVASEIQAAPALAVAASCGSSGAKVYLTGSDTGHLGNQPIVRAVSQGDLAITVAGMSGGVGCTTGEPCAQGADCVAGLSCGSPTADPSAVTTCQ
jgi:cysteine-rich repeat protein